MKQNKSKIKETADIDPCNITTKLKGMLNNKQ